jgi:release factor glutamine methyltransferase
MTTEIRTEATAGSPARWKVLSLIEWATNYLAARGVEDARLNAELLLGRVLGLPRIGLYANFDRPLETTELAEFKKLFQRRLKRMPLQYILGETEFMGLKLFVDENVLIPRPETEILVERTLETIRRVEKAKVDVLDIGTGSGNIPIAIAHFAKNVSVTSIDVSAAALKTAARNISYHRVTTITLIEGDLVHDPLHGTLFDVVVSNPPYVSAEEFSSLAPEVRDYEPRIATTDEADGFYFITMVSEMSAAKLCDGGWLLLEIGFGQSSRAQEIVTAAGFEDVEVFPDYAGIPRVVRARRMASPARRQ